MSADENRARDSSFVVRPARPEDLPAVWGLVREFAAFERMEHLATGSPEKLAAHLFGEAWPRVECLVADGNGRLGGYAIFYANISTFWVLPLMWLEDLFVSERHRGKGLGRMLFAAVARVAVERGCPRMDWAVLDWNAPAQEFYTRLGATEPDGWSNYRMTAEKLAEIAAEAPANEAR
jgi:GNAT superfamily N-acetyltransferase